MDRRTFLRALGATTAAAALPLAGIAALPRFEFGAATVVAELQQHADGCVIDYANGIVRYWCAVPRGPFQLRMPEFRATGRFKVCETQLLDVRTGRIEITHRPKWGHLEWGHLVLEPDDVLIATFTRSPRDAA